MYITKFSVLMDICFPPNCTVDSEQLPSGLDGACLTPTSMTPALQQYENWLLLLAATCDVDARLRAVEHTLRSELPYDAQQLGMADTRSGLP